jgi:hypothetical protein
LGNAFRVNLGAALRSARFVKAPHHGLPARFGRDALGSGRVMLILSFVEFDPYATIYIMTRCNIFFASGRD